MLKFYLALIILLFLQNFTIYCQNTKKIDSLLIVAGKLKPDSNKAKIFIEIGDLYELNKPDSSIFYYEKSMQVAKNSGAQIWEAKALRYIGIINCDKGNYDVALDYYAKALNIYETVSEADDKNTSNEGKRGIAGVYNNLGVVNINKGNYDDAIKFYDKAIKISDELGDKKSMTNYYHNIGVIYHNQGNYAKAIEYFMKALKILEGFSKSEDKSTAFAGKKGMADLYVNIGIIHFGQKNYEQANLYLLNALSVYSEIEDKRGLSLAYINLGNLYNDKAVIDKDYTIFTENNEKAIQYFNEAVKLKTELGDIKGLSYCYSNIAASFEKKGYITKNKEEAQNSFEIAIKYLNEAKNTLEKIDDKNGLAYVLVNIASLNLMLADSVAVYHLNKNICVKNALDFGLQAYAIANEIKANPLINDASACLQKAYTLSGNYKEALNYANVYINTQDSMYNSEKSKAIAEMEAVYQNEKKQLEIDKQNETIARKDAENKKQKTLLISFVLGFILIIVFSIFLYRMFLQKKKANIRLAEQNTEINQKNEEISAQRDEIETQRDLVTKQKEQIEEILTEQTDSIRYAKRIQNAVLPSAEVLQNKIVDHFIFFRPKDIVSGDFYWFASRKNWLLASVADCTGHGVPGAFMSMLGVSFLNDIVAREEIQTASGVLNHMRSNIIRALQQKGISGEQKDGMDISFIALDTSANKIQFAGANNPLWVIRPKPQDTSPKSQENPDTPWNLEFETCFLELKGDKMPIAIYERMEEFTNHELQLFSGDTIYMMSDGYEDQFGGPKGKKFLSKNLKQLLIDNCRLPMKEQKEILEKMLVEWIGNGEQIDDITILGIKI